MEPLFLLMTCAAASCLTFAVYGFDKAAAAAGRPRIPENVLHLLGLAGGWPGGWAACKIFRHKTRKLSFRLVFWITAIIHSSVVWLVVR